MLNFDAALAMPILPSAAGDPGKRDTGQDAERVDGHKGDAVRGSDVSPKIHVRPSSPQQNVRPNRGCVVPLRDFGSLRPKPR